MDAEDDPTVQDILDENAASLGKLRDLTDDLEAVVEHEKRIIEDAPPGAGKFNR